MVFDLALISNKKSPFSRIQAFDRELSSLPYSNAKYLFPQTRKPAMVRDHHHVAKAHYLDGLRLESAVVGA